MLGRRPQAQLRIRLALGPAQVRSQNHPRLVLQGIFDGGQGFANAGVVGDLPALIQGNVEIHADEHAFVGEGKIGDREFSHW